jgi:hypothetical protein
VRRALGRRGDATSEVSATYTRGAAGAVEDRGRPAARPTGEGRPHGPSLADTSPEHPDRSIEHVDRLPGIADLIGRADAATIWAAFRPEHAFISGRLVRHMDAIESSLYEPLQRLMAGRHSMAPMRREHEELLRLIDSLGDFATSLEAGELDVDDGIAFRRALYRLHSIVKVHIAEEELYLGVLDHNLGEVEKDELLRTIVRACEQPL